MAKVSSNPAGEDTASDVIGRLVDEGSLEHVGWQSQQHTPDMIDTGVHKH